MICQRRRFTKIISSHALEHVPNPYALLHALREYLDGSAKLLLLLPLDDWRASPNRRYNPADINHHLYTWTPQIIGNLLSETGYRSIEVEVVTDAMPPNSSMVEAVMKSRVMRAAVGNLAARFLLRRQVFARAEI